MAEEEMADVSEAEIAVHWQEEGYYHPPASFIGQANMIDEGIFERFGLDNFPDCFKEYADLLSWDKYWETTLDTSDPPFWKWFVGGRINACFNCVDRHLGEHKNKTAIHFVPEPEDEPVHHLTYQGLFVRVNELAALLRDFAGLKTGDRVTLHMPMVADLPITMLACARLGVIHSQVFSGFSGKAAADRIVDSESRVLITSDAYYRGGKLLDHKEKADIAVAEAGKEGHALDKVLVWQRYPGKHSSPTPMVEGRDFALNDVLKDYRGQRVEPVSLPAEAPLFLMYTSGTTGRPKGCQHSTGGYLSYVAGTSKYIQDIHPNDVYWCMADIGWITGHSYIVYGPLALAASSVVYEGVPNYPDAGRPWRIAEDLDVNIFHTSPTAIRALRRAGADEPTKYSYRFKHMTTVGEPIEPEVWKWYYNVVGKSKAAIVDTWWQTETGGFLCSTMPALHAMKPGSAGPSVPGIHPVIFDDQGNELPAGSGRAGNICIRNPWPGGFQTIWKDPDRFVAQYYARYCKDKKQHGLARLAVHGGRRRHAGGGRILSNPGPHRRRDQRRRTPAWHQGNRIGCPGRAGSCGSGGGPGGGPNQGKDSRPIRVLAAGDQCDRRLEQTNLGCHRDRNRADREAEIGLYRPRHAENAIRKNHAPGACGDFEQ